EDLPAVTATLKTLLAHELQMREEDVDENAQFVDLGLDSIGGVMWIRKINETYHTSIEATKIYSYPTLTELSRHVKQEADTRRICTRPSAPVVTRTPALTSWRGRSTSRVTVPPAGSSQPLAVIGIAGQFPH